VGVGLGIALSVADYQVIDRHHSFDGYVDHISSGAVEGFMSLGRGGTFS
jgi:hypothetical protein